MLLGAQSIRNSTLLASFWQGFWKTLALLAELQKVPTLSAALSKI